MPPTQGQSRAKQGTLGSDAVTYVDVFRQHLVRQLVFLENVVVRGCAGDHRAKEEAVNPTTKKVDMVSFARSGLFTIGNKGTRLILNRNLPSPKSSQWSCGRCSCRTKQFARRRELCAVYTSSRRA